MNFDEVRARDWMSPTVRWAALHETLRTALERMAGNGIHCLVVAAPREGAGCGVITMKDLVQVLCEGDDAMLDELKVEDVCTRPAITLPSGLAVSECMRLMRMTGIRSAPVVDAGEIVGVFSFSDVLREVARD